MFLWSEMAWKNWHDPVRLTSDKLMEMNIIGDNDHATVHVNLYYSLEGIKVNNLWIDF